MREIKFRAWDDLQKQMRPWRDRNDIEVLSDGTVRHIWPKLVLMQFTGLHDKNGKEIYEGDIITSDEGARATYEVIFRKGAFCVYKLGANHLFNDKKVAVIGNVYENPKLLQSAQR